MIHGTIGPKGRPGFLHPHGTGVINLVGDRRFVVDDEATQVIDEEGKPLVLTRQVYDDIRAEIASGASMYIEPAEGADEEELAELRQENHDLREALEEGRRRYEESYRAIEAELRQAREGAAELTERATEALRSAEEKVAAAAARVTELEGQLGAATARVAELEGAAASPKKPK